ncbi:MAG TPA: alpha/beta hydrolase [Acidimicrobiia bacterium]
MVRGSRRRLPPLLITPLLIVALAGCDTGGDVATSTSEPFATTLEVTSTSTSTSTTTTSTTTTTTSTTIPPTTTTIPPPLPEIDAQILAPEGTGPFPAVVLVHGGGWVAGDSSIMRPLAEFLTDEGFLTVNTNYTLSGQEPGFPAAVDDVACAVRYAAAHPDSNGTVVVVGHSAGAHLGAIVALNGDDYGGSCRIAGSGIPDRLVGLAGPYDVARLGLLMYPFFGAGPADDPEAWREGNPLNLVDLNPDLESLLMYGEEDGFVEPSFAFDFGDALTGAGSEALVEGVEGAQHNDMYLPRIVGDLIATWLER